MAESGWASWRRLTRRIRMSGDVPKTTVLYQLVQEHLETFLGPMSKARARRRGCPDSLLESRVRQPSCNAGHLRPIGSWCHRLSVLSVRIVPSKINHHPSPTHPASTAGIVSERYDAKRGLVREDAIAIRTAWQRSDFLPERDRAEAAALLRQYVDTRVKFAEERNVDPERVKNVLSETQRLQDRLWNMAVANARKDMNSDVAALYIDSLNEMSGIHAARVAVGIQARVPSEIWLVLYCITILGMMGVGYQTGIAGSKRSMARPILALSFALVFALIASLDRPDSGVMKVTQQPLIDLRDSMVAAAGRAEHQ